MPSGDSHHSNRRQRQQHEEHRGDGEGTDDCGTGPAMADRIAQHAHCRAEGAPVGDGVERPVQHVVEAHVEELHDGERPEADARDHAQHPSAPLGQHEGQAAENQAFDRDTGECCRTKAVDSVRREQREPDQRASQGGDRPANESP
jgi:hypothetical protein